MNLPWGVLLGGVLLLAAAFVVLKRRQVESQTSTPEFPRHRAEEIVSFTADQLATDSVGERWRLTFSSVSAPTLQFDLVIGAEQPSTNPGFNVARASLKRMGPGQGAELVRAVAEAFGVEVPKASGESADQLDFDVAILGRNLEYAPAAPHARVIAGSFTDNPAGDWTATKLFLADGEAEVFLALNARARKAMLLPKDPDYAQAVLEELSRFLR